MSLILRQPCTRHSLRLAIQQTPKRCLTTKKNSLTENATASKFKADSNQSSLLPGQFLVGPPHPISNIRPVKFYIPSDETPQERVYRELREDALVRDHEFWLDNNTRFEKGKLEFEQTMVAKTGSCTLDDLSVYYKQYQVDSYKRHLDYNRYVWKRNLAIIVPGIRAWWQETRRRQKRKVAGVASYSRQGYFDQDIDQEHAKTSHLDAGSAQTASTGAEEQKQQSRIAAKDTPSISEPSNKANAKDVDRRAEKIRSYY